MKTTSIIAEIIAKDQSMISCSRLNLDNNFPGYFQLISFVINMSSSIILPESSQ